MSENEEIYPHPWVQGTVFFNPETGEIHALGKQDIEAKDTIREALSAHKTANAALEAQLATMKQGVEELYRRAIEDRYDAGGSPDELEALFADLPTARHRRPLMAEMLTPEVLEQMSISPERSHVPSLLEHSAALSAQIAALAEALDWALGKVLTESDDPFEYHTVPNAAVEERLRILADLLAAARKMLARLEAGDAFCEYYGDIAWASAGIGQRRQLHLLWEEWESHRKAQEATDG